VQFEFCYLSIMEPDRWLGVELRHLIALEAVAREGSFGRAAVSLGYTQSAISQQIATLERIVGEKLIERPGGPRRVSLTEAGELLLRHGQAIVARLAAAQADLDALANGQAGTLNVGVYQSVGEHVLPALMQRFVEAWPRVDVRLAESANDIELLAQIERGELDLTFADLPLPEGPFEYEEVLRDPYVLVVPADLDVPEAPTLADVAELDLIGFRHCRSLNQLEASSPEPLRYVFRSDHNGTVQGMVATGFGAAIVPRLTVDPTDDRVRLVEFKDIPPRTIALAWHRDRHRGPAARAFVELAQEVSAELEGVVVR
jgi:DNA-binding transcriptional LysR family regulator